MKPSIPKGMRDFSPDEMVKRNYIFDSIRSVFQRYGYLPIETPAMENTETLTGKYGEEGDKLIFKVLNSGNFFDGLSHEKINPENWKQLTPAISEKALRYDLTVPFARYVVMNQNNITFPFKRYQIQPVWRADRPQKGRYREFYQCDADVIGSASLLNEVELIQITDDVFSKLGLKVLIQINNRKILAGISEYIGETEKIIDITVAIDKLDKIGLEKVNEELRNKGLSEKSINLLQPVININGTFDEKLNALKSILSNSEIGRKGIEECEFLFECFKNLPLKNSKLEIELTLARGLNYYTGAIIEVKPDDERTKFKSSILGGGRYDDLTGIFGLPNVSGVGISFGADRIYDVLEETGLFPQTIRSTTTVLFANFGKAEEKFCLGILHQARDAGISAELYPDQAKLKKQMSYADSRKIPFVVLIGQDEMQTGLFTVKNMQTGEQLKQDMQQLLALLT